jgi:Fic family protein
MLLEQEYDKVVISLKETHNAEHKIQEEVPEQEDADKVLEEREEVPEEPKKEPKESIKKQDKSIIILPQEKPQKELIDRHKKIIDFLKQNDHAQVWQLKNILPNVSKRTVRRDFEYLVGQKLVQRIGEKSNTFYRVVEIQ